MRSLNARRNPANLLQTVSVVGLTAILGGCAGDVMRFSDGFYTNSVPVRPPAAVQTPFPSNAPVIAQQGQPMAAPAAQPLPAPTTPSMVDPMSTGSIARSTVPAPVNRAQIAAPASQPLPPMPAANSQPTVQQLASSANQSVNQNAANAARQAAAAPTQAGWNAAGGTYVTLRQGETLFNLSRRYGVPVDALKRVNSISDARGVSAGQRILIPTYVHGRSAGVSAPDANPSVRSARSSTGGRADVDLASAPMPGMRPQQGLAANTTPTPAAQSAVTGGRYTVQSGDTLSAISRKTGASVAAIKRTNALQSDVVRIGQSLIIPGMTAGATSATQTAANVDPIVTSSISSRPAGSSSTSDGVSAIDNNSQARAPDATGVATMRWPVRGRVISAFGSNVGGRANDGIDISVPRGTQVKAAENGVVIYAGDGLKEFGQTVLVRHSDGYVTVYGHLDSMAVSRGDTVQRGHTLGASGMTGNARQPQLHFEVRKDSTPVDPIRYLN